MSPSEATQINDATVVRAHGNFESAAATASPIDEKPTAAVLASNVPETAIA
jgi:hypothetical protein